MYYLFVILMIERIALYKTKGVLQMDSRKKKMIAPIVITVLLILYYVVYFGFLISLLDGIGKWILGILPLAFSLLLVKVCIERIKEIRKGEEDDISKY